MKPLYIPLLALVGIGLCGPANAADRQLPGRVIRVIDGDSLILEISGGQHQIELAGIDAPEPNQPWGPAAADRLYGTLTGAFVVVTGAHADAQSRTIGTVIFKGRDVALDLIHDGLAWSTIGLVTEHPGDDLSYRHAEDRARQARRGLWSDDAPVPPWEWRRRRPGVTD